MKPPKYRLCVSKLDVCILEYFLYFTHSLALKLFNITKHILTKHSFKKKVMIDDVVIATYKNEDGDL